MRARGWIAATVLGLGLVGGGAAAADAPVHLIINGQPATGQPSPVLLGNTTYVPLRLVATALGAGVSWNGSTNTVTVVSPPQPAADQTPDLPTLIAQVRPSIVGVVAVTHDYTGEISQVSSGSGVVLTPDGVVVTNHHVIAGADTIYVVTDAHQTLTVATSSIWDDPVSDLAFLRTGDTALPPAHLGSPSPVQVGESVFTIGNPLGQALADTVTRGIVSGVGRYIGSGELYPVLQTDAAINPGNSGGALVDMNGDVIGITSEKLSGSELQGLGFAKPADLVAGILQSFQQHGYVVRPYMGLSMQDSQNSELAAYGVPVSGGPTVYSLDPTGPAAAAGMQVGDQIVAVDAQAVHTSSDVLAAINGASVGTTLAVTVQRGNAQVVLQVRLVQRPAGQ